MLNNIAALHKFRCMMTKEMFCSLVVEIGFTVVFVLIVLIYFPTCTSLNFIFFCFTAYFQATVHSTMGNKRRLVNALACSKRSDSGERCEVKKAMKSRGGLGTEVLAFIFSRSFLRRTAPHYLNAWNRLQRFGLLSSSFQERPGLELILLAYSRRIISFF